VKAAPPITLAARGAVRIITLDRTANDNAVAAAMVAALASAVPPIARDPGAYAIVLRGAAAGAYHGGDNSDAVTPAPGAGPIRAVTDQVDLARLVWLLECLSKPVISLMDGVVAGTGAALTLVNTHRVAAAGYAFAVPQVSHGWFPDGGILNALAKLPDGIGAYLALTGRRIERADAFALGLVTHCIDADQFDHITAALADAQTVDRLLDGLHRAPGEAPLTAVRPAIATCFTGTTVADICSRLQQLGRDTRDPTIRSWVQHVLDDIADRPPHGLALTLRHLQRSAGLDLRQTLMVDARIASRLIASVRSVPNRPPASIATVAMAAIEDLLRPGTADELHLPTRQEMQAARV
jgi:enoyl-CoA hydratase